MSRYFPFVMYGRCGAAQARRLRIAPPLVRRARLVVRGVRAVRKGVPMRTELESQGPEKGRSPTLEKRADDGKGHS
jgi:hypothetical protein